MSGFNDSQPTAINKGRCFHEHTEMTLAMVQSQMQSLSSGVSRDSSELCAIVQRHGKAIRTRWEKKTKAKRLMLLTQAESRTTRFSYNDVQEPRSITSSCSSTSATQLDLDILASHKNLLPLWIRSRGNGDPFLFIGVDSMAAFMRQHDVNCFTPFDGLRVKFFPSANGTSRSYCEVMATSEIEALEKEAPERTDHFPVHTAVFMLKDQSTIFSFLLQCSRLILHDLCKAGWLNADPSSSIPHSIAPDMASDHSDELLTILRERPYRSPAKLNLKRLITSVGSRLTAAEDHLTSLRVDPSYFEQLIREMKKQQLENILDTYGRTHPMLHEDTFYERCIDSVLALAFQSYHMWKGLVEQLDHLEHRFGEWITTTSGNNTMPGDLGDAIAQYLHFVGDHQNVFSLHLFRSVFGSPGMRHFFLCENWSFADEDVSFFRESAAIAREPKVARFLYMVDELKQKNSGFFGGACGLFEQAVDIMTNETKGRAPLIGRFQSELLFDNAILMLCADEFMHWAPWLPEKRLCSSVIEADHNQEESKKRGPGLEVWDIPPRPEWSYKSGWPIDGRFTYPVNKRVSQQNLQAMSSAEANLDAFWESVLPMLRSLQAIPLGAEEFLQESAQKTVVPIVRAPSLDEHHDPVSNAMHSLSDLHFELQSRTEATLEKSTPAIKQAKDKTRLETPAEPTTAPIHAPPAVDLATESNAVYKVSRRALKVFDAMFITPSTTGQPGEVNWRDLVNALTSAPLDFTAMQVYGSVWLFTSPGVGGRGKSSIELHAPHSGKIPIHILRAYGRRLNRKFGWTRDSFELA